MRSIMTIIQYLLILVGSTGSGDLLLRGVDEAEEIFQRWYIGGMFCLELFYLLHHVWEPLDNKFLSNIESPPNNPSKCFYNEPEKLSNSTARSSHLQVDERRRRHIQLTIWLSHLYLFVVFRSFTDTKRRNDASFYFRGCKYKNFQGTLLEVNI